MFPSYYVLLIFQTGNCNKRNYEDKLKLTSTLRLGSENKQRNFESLLDSGYIRVQFILSVGFLYNTSLYKN